MSEAKELVVRVSMREEMSLEKMEPPPFIDTRKGGVHVQEGGEVVVLPRIGGVEWRATVESTLCRTRE